MQVSVTFNSMPLHFRAGRRVRTETRQPTPGRQAHACLKHLEIRNPTLSPWMSAAAAKCPSCFITHRTEDVFLFTQRPKAVSAFLHTT